MPERLIDLLFRFLSQNDGRLSQRAREKEFAALLITVWLQVRVLPGPPAISVGRTIPLFGALCSTGITRRQRSYWPVGLPP